MSPTITAQQVRILEAIGYYQLGKAATHVHPGVTDADVQRLRKALHDPSLTAEQIKNASRPHFKDGWVPDVLVRAELTPFQQKIGDPSLSSLLDELEQLGLLRKRAGKRFRGVGAAVFIDGPGGEWGARGLESNPPRGIHMSDGRIVYVSTELASPAWAVTKFLIRPGGEGKGRLESSIAAGPDTEPWWRVTPRGFRLLEKPTGGGRGGRARRQAEQWYPGRYYEQFNIMADTLRRAAHRKRIRSRKQGGKLNYYNHSDVCKTWPDLIPPDQRDKA